MVEVTKRQTRWRWSILIVVAVCVAAGLLQVFQRPGKPTGVNPLSPVAPAQQSSSIPDVAPQETEISRPDRSHVLDRFLQEAGKAREALKDVRDYSAVFDKREQVGRKLIATKINLKVRTEPFSVYLKFVEPKANAGRQVVYVQDGNSNNLLVQEAGYKSILGIQPLQPTGSLAMADNRYPVTMIGLQKMLDLVIAQWESDRAHDDIATRIETDAKLPSGAVCTVYESVVPTPRDKVQFHITRLWIDDRTQLAIRVEQLGFPGSDGASPPILEDYTYSNVRTNIGLSDDEFNAKKAFQP